MKPELARKKLVNPVRLAVAQAFGLKLSSTKATRPRLGGRANREPERYNYRCRFRFPTNFPAGAWATIMGDEGGDEDE